MMEEAQIVIENAQYAYGETAALAGVTLRIRAGERVCILGSNGSGKSTLLQLMNALVLANSGTVHVMGIDPAVADGALAVRRQVAMVFQHPEDQMVTSVVADDVAFGPENLGVPSPEIAQRVEAALAAVSMSDEARRDPADLSGGQKQRVAIAGALAMGPRVLLLDEPAAMLDAEGHREIHGVIDRLSGHGITIVHVTHFMDDALAADRVVVMDGGRVVMDDTPARVFEHREMIERLGLELPFHLRVAHALIERGLAVPPVTDESGLVLWLQGQMQGWNRPQRDSSAAHQIQTAHATGAEPPVLQDGHLVRAQGAEAALVFDHVSFSYAERGNRNAPAALTGFSCSLMPGTLTALVGRTGSGKSTVASLACALRVPSSGTVKVGGTDTTDRKRRRELRRLVGFVAQLPERQLFARTIFEDVAFGPRNLGCPDDEVGVRVRTALTAVGFPADEAFLARSPFALSGGQQHSVALAGVLAMRQPILVLDEPMAGLDPAGRARMRSLLLNLKEAGTTLLLITHSMEDAAELADRVIALEAGRTVADGSPRTVFGAAQPQTPGIPAALRLARSLAGAGILPAASEPPLTLGALVDAIAAALGEVGPDGVAR